MVLGARSANDVDFLLKSHNTFLSGMAHAPKGAKVTKKRGLLGFLDTKGPNRGVKMTPKHGVPGLRRGQKFSLWHEFLTSGLLAVMSSDASTPPRGA
jgi:hypothetical protein